MKIDSTRINNSNYELIIEKFLNWEFEHNLDKIYINEIPIWFFMRDQLFSWLLFKILFKDNSTLQSGKQTRLQFINKNLLQNSKEIASSFVKSYFQLFKNKTIKIIAFSYPGNRKKNTEGLYFNTFYDPVFDYYKNEDEVCIIELPAYKKALTHYKNNYKKKRIIFGDILYLKELLKSTSKEKREIYHIFNMFQEFALSSFNIKVNKEAQIFYNIQLDMNRLFKRVKVFDEIIKKYSPETILLTSAYSPTMRLITLLAKKRRVRILELQHGHIYPYHFGYRYHKEWNKYKKELPIVDEIFVFGNFYKSYLNKNGFWANDEVTVMGNPFFNSKDREKEPISSVKNNQFQYTILIISQHTMTEQIIKFLDGFEKHKEILFLIKTHPSGLEEYDQYKQSLVPSENMLIVKSGNIFDYLLLSDVSVGIYTSGLIDSISAGIPACTINIEGKNLLYDLVEEGYICSVDSLVELIGLVKNGYNKQNYETKKIYSEYDPQIIVDKIK